MSVEDYNFIRQISWMALIRSKVGLLPLDVHQVTSAFNFEKQIEPSGSLWSECRHLSLLLLSHFGISTSKYNLTMLSIRLLAPACILYECNCTDTDSIMALTKLPHTHAETRAARMKTLLARNKFYLSNDEVMIRNNFNDFIAAYNHRRRGLPE